MSTHGRVCGRYQPLCVDRAPGWFAFSRWATAPILLAYTVYVTLKTFFLKQQIQKYAPNSHISKHPSCTYMCSVPLDTTGVLDKSLALQGRNKLMFLSEWREFPSAPCLAGRKTWWKLASRCCWNRARLLTCFRACFLPGRAKDLSAPSYVLCSHFHGRSLTPTWHVAFSQTKVCVPRHRWYVPIPYNEEYFILWLAIWVLT